MKSTADRDINPELLPLDRPQGEIPEFTPRAIIAGVILGVLIMSENVYLGLKTGSTEAGSILSSILCFAMFRAARQKLSILENNIAQTLSSAAGSIGIAVSAVPALQLMGFAIAGWQVFLWLLLIAFLGLFFAIPLRKQLIVTEGLTYPTGRACATTITAMHAEGDTAVRKARALGLTGLFSGAITWFRDAVPIVIPSGYFPPLTLGRYALEDLSLGFSWSPILLGVGTMVGLRIGVSLLLGGLLSWAIVGPALVDNQVIEEFGGRAVREWMMWPAIALMVASGFTALAMKGGVIMRSIRSVKEVSSERGGDSDFPMRWWIIGILGTSIAVIIMLQLLFQVPLWLGFLIIVLAFVLSTVAMRAYGETDVNPVGTMGHANQIAAGLASPGNAVSNLAAGSVSAGCADVSADLMQVFKTGHLLGASSRRQIYAQFIGVAVGVLTAVFVLTILTQAYALGSDELPAPGALPWKGVAELLSKGADALPPHGVMASLVGAIVGILLTLLERKPLGRLLPSPFGLGIGLVLPGFYSCTIFLGAAIGAFIEKTWRSWSESYLMPIASGAIAGEAIVGVVIAILTVLGVLGG